MRIPIRDKKTVYYANYASKTEIIDEYGNATGQYTISYTAPTAIDVNVSPSRGKVDAELFGINTNYSKTLVVDDGECPIDKHSILWVDKEPSHIEDDVIIPDPHDYVVVEVARMSESVVYAIKEVNVS